MCWSLGARGILTVRYARKWGNVRGNAFFRGYLGLGLELLPGGFDCLVGGVFFFLFGWGISGAMEGGR